MRVFDFFHGLTRSDAISLVGILISLIGFGLMIWQLVRTANASIATQQSMHRTERRMVYNHMLVLIPQFRLLEVHLDEAAETDDRRLAIRTLVAFSQLASEVAGLLGREEDIPAEIVDKLQESAGRASVTKANVIDNPRQAVKSSTKTFRGELAELTTHIGGLLGRLQVEAGRPS